MFFKIEGINLEDLGYRQRTRFINRVGDFYRLNLEARGIEEKVAEQVQVDLGTG